MILIEIELNFMLLNYKLSKIEILDLIEHSNELFGKKYVNLAFDDS